MMNGDSHDLLLGAYSMGILDLAEAGVVERHLAGCAMCRQELAELAEVRDMLALVPPEALHEGPPADRDLVPRGTPRGVGRADHPRSARFRSRLLVAAAAMVVVTVSVGGGVLVGRRGGGPAAPTPATALPAGTRSVTTTNKALGITMTATVIPAVGWVRVKVQMNGAPAGIDCRIMVLATDGTARQAGSWRTSGSGKTPVVDGSADVAPAGVAAVEVDTAQGEPLITARF
jgi:hypothetical protein